jgi:hypothetical protein
VALQFPAILSAGVLHAAIGMMDHSSRVAPLVQAAF